MQTCKSTCMCTKWSMCAHSGRAVGAPKCLSQSSAATSGISRAPCAGAAGGFPFYPSGKQALVLQSPACAGALLHAAHSDLADYCREGLNSARAPHALPFSLQLQDSPCLLWKKCFKYTFFLLECVQIFTIFVTEGSWTNQSFRGVYLGSWRLFFFSINSFVSKRESISSWKVERFSSANVITGYFENIKTVSSWKQNLFCKLSVSLNWHFLTKKNTNRRWGGILRNSWIAVDAALHLPHNDWD